MQYNSIGWTPFYLLNALSRFASCSYCHLAPASQGCCQGRYIHFLSLFILISAIDSEFSSAKFANECCDWNEMQSSVFGRNGVRSNEWDAGSIVERCNEQTLSTIYHVLLHFLGVEATADE